MKNNTRWGFLALLSALSFSAFAAPAPDAEWVLPAFEISISEEDDALVEIIGEIGLIPPQTPDTLSVDLTNELLGAGLAKVVVKKGVKSVKKLFKKAKSAHAERVANRNFPRKGCCGTVRVVSYNVGVFTKSGYNKMNMAADMLGEMKADVAGIQELDSCVTRTGGVYQLAEFAIVSKKKFRILDSWFMTLDRGKGAEQRALNVVEFPKFVLATTHLDHKNDAAQLAQAKKISEVLMARYAGTHKVVILSGDFNAKPNSKTIKEMKKNWTIVSAQSNTYDSSRPKQCIDYIMVMDNNSSYVLRHTAVPTKFDDGDVTQASDHLPVYVDIKPKRR